MGTLERTAALSHEIGETGRVEVKGVTGAIRVRGVDGGQVRLTVTYRVRAADRAAAERALEAGEVRVERGADSLRVETAERTISTGLSWLFGGTRVMADLELEVPRAAAVNVETVSGSVEAGGLLGDQRYRAVSGDVRVRGASGSVDANSVSGSIAIEGPGELRVRASNVSGRIRARAGAFDGLRVSTTSGEVVLEGAFDPGGDHHVDSLSGALGVAAIGGLTVDVKSLTSSIRSEVEHRLEGGHGATRAVVGDGRARLRFNTTSGQLRLLRPPAAPSPGAAWAAAAPPPATEATWTAHADDLAGSEPAADARWTPGLSDAAAVEPAAAAVEPAAATNGSRPAPAAGESGAGDGAADDRQSELDVLQALERGEIGVDEAALRLERLRR